jgi:signal peptidase I
MNQRQQLRGQFSNEVQLKAASEERARENVWNEYTVTTRPVDKRENYIKRCVGIPGDTIQIKAGLLYVGNRPAYVSPTSAIDYTVITSNNQGLSPETLADAGVKISGEDGGGDFRQESATSYKINLTVGEAEIVRKMPGVISVERALITYYDPLIFPRDTSVARWSVDEFGPLWIPKKGVTIPLTKENIAFYKRTIRIYEHNDWEERDGKIFINGQEATTYTFKMNYYWMMGDNRHRSQDSRFWGFVPEDHVVGEAWLIWMSWDQGIRWNRLFKTIH